MITPTEAKEIFVFLGPPGSGKGSLATLCLKRIGWETLSTGNLCRKHIAEQTEIGKEIDFAIKSGKLIADELISQMVEHRFAEKAEAEKSIIFDGYPRTVKQAEAFDRLLKNKAKQLRLRIVQLVISDEMVVKRLSLRFTCSNKECQAVYSMQQDSSSACVPKAEGICSQCGDPLTRRADDEAIAITKRLQVYYQHAQDLLNFYEKMGYPIIKIDVEKPLEAVFEDFTKHIGITSV
jgi:adenylate kinase